MDIQPPSVEGHIEKQLPPVTKTTLEDQLDKEKEKIEKTTKKKDEKEKAKVKQQTDDDDDDSINIQGPIDVDKLSAYELMEIASVMQSRAQKKRLKEQRKEAETIQTVVEILSSLLPETETSNLSTPIAKLG